MLYFTEAADPERQPRGPAQHAAAAVVQNEYTKVKRGIYVNLHEVTLPLYTTYVRSCIPFGLWEHLFLVALQYGIVGFRFGLNGESPAGFKSQIAIDCLCWKLQTPKSKKVYY